MALVRYVARRLATIALSISVLIVITYCLMYAAPGNFFDIQRYQTAAGASNLTKEQVEIIRRGFERKYGLDQPLWKQVLVYLKDAARFRFGPSFSNPGVTIEEQIARAFPVTLSLGLLGMALAIALGIPLGIVAALRRNTWIDYGSTVLAMSGQIVPSYVVAVLLIVLFSVTLRWLPTSGWGTARHMVLPVIAVALGPMGVIARFTRISLLDALNQDYVRTAYAKGGTERAVVIGHALRNSLIPIVTVVGPNLAGILAGSAVWIEQIFRVPGVGQLFVTAAGLRDYPLLVTSTFVLALSVMLVNLVVDITYALLDPRIRLE